MATTCPRPDVEASEIPSNTGTYTGNPPTQRGDNCNVVSQSITSQGPGTSTETTVTTPAQAPVQDCILGMKWEGEWEEGKEYKKQTCFTNPNGSVVKYDGSSWLCIVDHTSTADLSPTLIPPEPPLINGNTYWEPLAEGQEALDKAKEAADANKSWWDKVLEWVDDMDIWDWLKVAAIAAGLVYAGVKLLDAMDEDGEKDGAADKRYNGSPGYSGSYTPPTLKNVLIKLCQYGAITCDVSLLQDEQLEFTIASSTSVRTILQQLSIAYNFDMVNSGGVLKFIPRLSPVVDEVTLQDMGFSANVTPPAPYVSKRFQGIDIPRKINVSYFSPSLNGNTYTQTAELFVYEDGNELNVNIPITLTDYQARKIAELNLINAHLERMNYKFTTNYKFVHLEPGDNILSPMGIVRITKINEVEDGLLNFECCDSAQSSLSLVSNLDYSVPIDNTISKEIGYSDSFFIDPPWTGPGDTGIRLYSITHGYGKQNWPGAIIYISRDGINYSPLMTVQNESKWGITQSILGNNPGGEWDTANTLTVKLKVGELSSAADEEVIAGKNWIYVGQELIGFGEATLIADKTYTLSRLKRGLRGTYQFSGTHVSNEVVVLFNSLNRIELLETDYNKTLYFKTVTIGSTIDVADLETVKVISNNNKLWQPINGTAECDISTNNWVLNWDENLRSPDVYNNNASNLVQVDEDQSGWGLAIMDLNDNVIRTIPVGYTTYTYTAEQQIEDFGAIQCDLKASIVPMHKKYGGGYPLVITGTY